MKAHCTIACDLLVIELERRFPNHELMNALGIIYGHNIGYNQIVNSLLWTIYPWSNDIITYPKNLVLMVDGF